MASLHAAALLFGFAGLFAKWLTLSPESIVLGRTMIASAVLAALLRASRRPQGRFEWRFAVSGAILALHWIAFFRAIQISSVAVGLLGFASFPIFVLLVEARFLQRKLRIADFVTIALVTSGLLFLVPEYRLGNDVVRGLMWGVVSAFLFALLAVCNRESAARQSPAAVAMWQNVFAAACLLPGYALDPVLPGPRELVLLIVLGIFCTALAHALFIHSMRVLSAHTASVVVALEPVYGIALAFVLLGETPGWRTMVGAALIVGAALRATWLTGAVEDRVDAPGR